MSYSDIKELFNNAKNLAIGANERQLKNILSEIQTQVNELQEENKELLAKIHVLEKEDIINSKLVYHQGVFSMGDDLEEIYCPICWDKNRRLVRIRKIDKTRDGMTAFSCDVCQEWRFSDIPYED